MEDDSSWENITDWVTFGTHIFDIYNFRGNKARSTTPDKQILLFLGMSSESKIANGQILWIVMSEDDILGLEVTMDDFMFGEMREGL